MLLVSSTWANEPTFKMIPINVACPFNEAIYDPSSRALALVGKEKKQTLHMLPRLTDSGDVQRIKLNKRDNGKDFAEQRVTLDTFYEYFIEEKSEIENFIKSFASNAATFDFESILDNSFAAPTEKPTMVQGSSLIVAP
jgi:hypothetical protein